MRLSIVLLILFSVSTATAAPTFYHFDSDETLRDSGWLHDASPESLVTFEDGLLTFEGPGPMAWRITNAAVGPGWKFRASAQRGWWYEVRVRADVFPDEDCLRGINFYVSDGGNLIRARLNQDTIEFDIPVLSETERQIFDHDPRDGFHTYRIENRGNAQMRILIDGEELLAWTGAVGERNFGWTGFGSPNECDYSLSTWDYLAYDTDPAFIDDPAQDSDGDGLSDDVDNCPEDSNLFQADSDGDTIGDACDDCPDDPLNDLDEDGLCDDEDNSLLDQDFGIDDFDDEDELDDVEDEDELDDVEGNPEDEDVRVGSNRLDGRCAQALHGPVGALGPWLLFGFALIAIRSRQRFLRR